MSFARRLRRNKQVNEGYCQFCDAPAARVRLPPGQGFHAYHADPICPEWQRFCEARGGKLLDKTLTLAEYEEMVRKVEAK